MCSIRHHYCGTIVEGRSFRDKRLASSRHRRARRFAILENIVEIEGDGSAAWPSPKSISGLSTEAGPCAEKCLLSSYLMILALEGSYFCL